MTTITEGSLTFTFPDEWSVVKYDDAAFYKMHLSGGGFQLKAVDIVAYTIKPLEYLLFIEIKDFREHGKETRKRITSGELYEEVLQKLLHTMAGLYAAYKPHGKGLETIYPVLFPVPERLELVLFMEDDIPAGEKPIQKENRRKRRQDLEIKLRCKLKPLQIACRILDRTTLRARDQWQAEDT